MRRIQVQVSHQTHRENYLRDFRVVEPVIVLTHIREDDMADRREHVAEARWHAKSTIIYTENVPQFGATVFITVEGPVEYRKTKTSEWEMMLP
jgi:hypothetical protein